MKKTISRGKCELFNSGKRGVTARPPVIVTSYLATLLPGLPANGRSFFLKQAGKWKKPARIRTKNDIYWQVIKFCTPGYVETTCEKNPGTNSGSKTGGRSWNYLKCNFIQS